MDDRWQQSKCGPTWRPVTSAAATGAAAQVQPQDSMNPMINLNHNSYPQVVQEPSSSTCKMMADPFLPFVSNFNAFNSGHSVMGSSLFSLLSGTPSFLQCDSPQASSFRPINPHSIVPLCSSSSVVGPTGCEVSFSSPKVLPQNIDNCYPKSRVDTCPAVPTRAMANAGGSNVSYLHDLVQSRKVNDPSLELSDSHTLYGVEKLNGFPSLKAVPNPIPTATQSLNRHGTSSQIFPSLLETRSAIPHQFSALTSDFPRVFCLYASGDLLLIDHGLLGVVCSCHGLHMSISKFLEHSGLRDVNPGDAVHMDSGETIAQWRKVYFRKFGIRIPDDHCGWDWPEGFAAAGDVVKSSNRVFNVSRSTDLSSAVGPSRAFVALKQSSNNVVLPNNPPTGQKVRHAEPERNARSSCKFLNGFGNPSQSNVHSGIANKTIELSVSGCLSMSNLAGASEKDFQSSSMYIDSILKTKNTFDSLKNLESLSSFPKDSDIFGFKNLRGSEIMDKLTVSSNIELRLGQPSQQSQTLGKSNASGFNAPRINRANYALEANRVDQKFPNGCSSITEKSRQIVNCAAEAAKLSSRSQQNQFKFANLGFGDYSMGDAFQSARFKSDLTAGSVNSILISHMESPKRKMHSKDSSNVANDSNVMPKQQILESPVAKFESMSLGRYRDGTTEAHFSVSDLGNYRFIGRDRGFGHDAARENFPDEVDLGCHVKLNGGPSSSSGFLKPICDKNPHSHKLPNIPSERADAGLIVNHSGTVSSLGGSKHVTRGSVSPVTSKHMASRPPLPSRPLSEGVSAVIEGPSNLTSILSKEEVVRSHPCLLDHKLRVVSLRQPMEHSNQDLVSSTCGVKDQKISVNSLSGNVKSSIGLSSKSAEQKDEHNVASNDPSALAMVSVHSADTYWTCTATEKSAAVAVSEETLLQIRDIGMQHHLGYDPHQAGPPLPRVGKSENNICSSSEHGKCCQGTPCLPDKCSSYVKNSSFDENCNLKGKSSLGTFPEQSQIRASVLSASNLENDCTLLGNKSTSSSKFGELMKPNLRKIGSNAFQWKDVPSKITKQEHVPCKDQQAEVSGSRTDFEVQSSDVDVAPKSFNQSVEKAHCTKEQVMSNISSKCSAPAVTQASVKISNGDSCIDDAQNADFAKNFAVDEGSGIEKSWSSDDAFDCGSNNKSDGFACKANLKNEALSKVILNRSNRSLIDELRVIDSLRLKKAQHIGPSMHEKTNSTQKFEKDFEAGGRRNETKCEILNRSFFPASPISSVSTGSSERSSQSLEDSEDTQMMLQPSRGKSHNCTCSVDPGFMRKRSIFSASLNASSKQDVYRFDRVTEKHPYHTPGMAYHDSLEVPEALHRKKLRLDQSFSKTKLVWTQETDCTAVELTRKCNSVSCRITSSSQQENVCKRFIRPVICGRYGLISNGDTSKPAKIFSLRKILKTARRCGPAGNKVLKKSPAKALKKSTIREGDRRSARISNFKKEKDSIGQGTAVLGDFDPMGTPEGMEVACSKGWTRDTDASYMLEKENYLLNEKICSIPDRGLGARLKRKIKEVRKRSLHELITEERDSVSATFAKERALLPQNHLKNSEEDDNLAGVDRQNRSPKEHCKSIKDVHMFCQVCGSLNNDEMNCLLKCDRCLIRVHQACYGISKVPKSYWYCRPCRENATNIACVLCGYEGGVMTRAVHSSDIVKSLVNSWNFVTESPENQIIPSQVLEDQLNADVPSGPAVDIDAPPNSSPEHLKSFPVDMMVKTSAFNDKKMLNSIVAGVVDSSVKQWVHMVCGLWTPGTRCPNVDTMSTFDVSGAACPTGNEACSMCKRFGGCCIKCRVMDCAIQFHPWCAHQKGLLQSEIEGADNEKVGFYGRCELHATVDHGDNDNNSGNMHINCPKEMCARTEGYKGRKREGFRHDIRQITGGPGGCLVPQEQLDAWNHINRQLSYKQRLQKPPLRPVQDKEYDCRKEYTRYKQAKGWKHLIVYKSGIHALGLYTSWFISRGAMVVEYVGEIVGLRVADRREKEYQSGKKLQYKSACYFFRIDKEHIIDATRKGGIARFVNHSCEPNCVAKVITVRGEKKVVFFAERDIYPGEEITYDYHFNNEDEGKKIMCSCNSKNCRRYLN